MYKIIKDHTARNVARTICFECQKMGFVFSPEEIKYVIECQICNPNGNFSGLDSHVEKDVKKLADLCVHYLCNSSSTVLKAIMIQAAFITTYKDREAVIDKHKHLIAEQTQRMIDDICMSNPKTLEQRDALYKKIVLITVLLSGLGDPSVKNVYSNAEAALNSIFPLKNIQAFLALNCNEKLCELNSLEKTITGIRLYNQARVSKEDIHPEMKLVADACSRVRERLEPALQNIAQGVRALERLLDRRACLNRASNENIIDASDFLKFSEMQDATDYMVIIEQTKIYLMRMLSDAQTCQQEYYKAKDVFTDSINSLNSDLEGKHAVPMHKVLPKFKVMGEKWSQIQELKVLIVAIYSICANILSQMDVKRLPKWANKLLSQPENIDLSVKEMVNIVFENRINVCDTHYMIDHENITECEFLGRFSLARSALAYNGFCPVTCLESGGLLLEGNISIGLLRYNSVIYSFRHADAAYKFDKDPKGYIAGLVDFARTHIGYIEVLGLQDIILKLHKGTTGPLGVKVEERKPLVRDTSMQTDVHPIQTLIDPTYSWNIWDYKKQALLMANITNSRTRSSQTLRSEVREGASTQTYSPRERCAQTAKDQGSHTAAAVTYLARLRGSNTDAFTAYMLSPPDIDCIKGLSPRMPCEEMR